MIGHWGGGIQSTNALLVDWRGNCVDKAATAGTAINGDLTARCPTLIADAGLLTFTFNKACD
jgi:hypothetical protein